MTVDYPDWTRLMQIIGTNIMVAIDMQASYIMMPIDIQGQVDDLNINIDIKAQTIGNLTIDINAQHVAMYLAPDWNVKEGNGKAWNITGANKATDATITQAYTPSGATLYITQVSAVMFGYADADKDKDQVFELDIGGVYAGGNGGCQFLLPNPIKIASGIEINMTMYNRANHNTTMFLSVRGYEI